MTDLHATVRPIGIGGLHSLTDVTVLSVPHDAIRRLAARYPAVAEALWRDCMLDAAILMQRVVNVGRGNAAARLAHLFCEMARRYGNGQQPLLRYDFPVTQEQLGEATAITSVHVNRTLRALREASLISFERGVVAINDWGRLVKAAEFNAEYLTGDAGPERRKRLLTV
jgi:CRP-like cAMP-binding protein